MGGRRGMSKGLDVYAAKCVCVGVIILKPIYECVG